MPTITFVNEKVTVDAEVGEDLRTVARRNGIQLYSGPHKIVNCMGFGTCGSCSVVVKSGIENASSPSIREKVGKWANPVFGVKVMSHPDEDVRLACQTKVEGDMEIVTTPPINFHGEKFWN